MKSGLPCLLSVRTLDSVVQYKVQLFWLNWFQIIFAETIIPVPSGQTAVCNFLLRKNRAHGFIFNHHPSLLSHSSLLHSSAQQDPHRSLHLYRAKRYSLSITVSEPLSLLRVGQRHRLSNQSFNGPVYAWYSHARAFTLNLHISINYLR